MLGSYGDRPGADNVHNHGGFASVLFSRDGHTAPGAGARGWWPEGMLHEITHNLGGVQWSAPHSTQPFGGNDPRFGHCWQGADVMCYVEDAGASHAMRNDCPRIGGAIRRSTTAGATTTSTPRRRPAPIWRRTGTSTTTTSSRRARGSSRRAAAAWRASCRSRRSPPPARRSSAHRAAVTSSTANGGIWRNGPISYAYRWQRERRGKWVSIAGATRATYRAKRADRGRRLRVQVVATNQDGRASAASPPTARVADGMVGQAQTVSSSDCSKGRARRTAARCRGQRTSKAAAKRRR